MVVVVVVAVVVVVVAPAEVEARGVIECAIGTFVGQTGVGVHIGQKGRGGQVVVCTRMKVGGGTRRIVGKPSLVPTASFASFQRFANNTAVIVIVFLLLLCCGRVVELGLSPRCGATAIHAEPSFAGPCATLAVTQIVKRLGGCLELARNVMLSLLTVAHSFLLTTPDDICAVILLLD